MQMRNITEVGKWRGLELKDGMTIVWLRIASVNNIFPRNPSPLKLGYIMIWYHSMMN